MMLRWVHTWECDDSVFWKEIEADSICSSFELSADESRDLSQAEIKIVKDEQIHKMATIFSQNGKFWRFWVKITWKDIYIFSYLSHYQENTIANICMISIITGNKTMTIIVQINN